MKCPKCGYLGFETGDRCKNCGYDFSLLARPGTTASHDLPIRPDDAETSAPPELWLDRMTSDEAGPPPASHAHPAGVSEAPERLHGTSSDSSALPLFNPEEPDDIPLIALPPAPRAPLAVRRPAESPRLRAVPRVARLPSAAFDFREEADLTEAEAVESAQSPPGTVAWLAAEGIREVGGRRVAAAIIDHAILFTIDLTVFYFTLRVAGLSSAEVRLLPIAPLVTFLGLLKLAYFSAFTAAGGQTIGKMSVGIQVIADRGSLDAARALRRTLAGLLSLLPVGLGFLPAFFGADRRTLHDRLTGTRVVGLPSA